ncbi:uncharacterized protein F4812DRAFT_306587 [Daldinia caldariorum]|uniref:uncharacterized protein n=1 Tax=Daldinia caldariorum TaxID=326644 RepID=UPI0020071E7A|nr:uncharacterized protein F4812DRAFT_306587 [Daldinia caldariorum]KAI1469913.1 hypothetical protein F4812DRAFT_306587 [Daldinia caldariorum]
MSRTSSSHNTALAESISEPDWDCVGREGYDYFYIDKFTEERPPHLNNKNFSSTQPVGSATQPRRCPMIKKDRGAGDSTEHVSTDSVENYTFVQYAPSSANTNETLKRGDPFGYRPDLDYYKNRNYAAADSAQPLTVAAVAALDYTNHAQSFDGNIYGWMPRVGRVGQADPADYWSTSHLITKAPKSRSSMATNMSWCVVPSAQEHHDAEMLRDVGGWSDIPADPRTAMARSIRDEDMLEA